MAADSTSFEYQPLDVSKNEIRVLRILPGTDTDTLQCLLEHISLDDPADFEALSYAWHDPTLFPEDQKNRKHVLMLNGKCLEIGNNLALFIKSGRSKQAHTRRIWIDAVCINQKNVYERNEQVLRMREIYQKAKQVVIWLGPASNHSEVAVKFLKWVFDQCPRGREAQWFKKFIQENTLVTEWKAMASFLGRAWWNRIWIVQEVVLAKEALILCGTVSMTWTQLEYSLHYTSNALDDIKDQLQEPGDYALIRDRVRKIGRLTAIRRRKDNLNVVDVFDNIGGNDCTDKRDKIYGLLGIIPDADLIVPEPNYALDVDEVHRRAFGLLAVETRNLDFLSLITNRPKNIRSGGFPPFPSWCPDMTSSYFRNIHRLNTSLILPAHSEPQFCASGTRPAIARLSTNANIIRLSGIRVDVVDGVFPGESGFRYNLELTRQALSGRSVYESEDQTYEALWRSFVAGLNIYTATEGTYAAPAQFGELFARQCCVAERQHQKLIEEGTEVPFDITNPSSITSVFTPEDPAWPFNTWYKYNRDALFAGRSVRAWAERYNPGNIEVEGQEVPLDQMPMWKDFSGSWGPANFGRRMVTTEKGYIGMALELSRRGDLVCVLFGCRMPVVLRPEGDYFRFMGECYIHGLMFGEGIEDFQRGEYDLEKFELI